MSSTADRPTTSVMIDLNVRVHGHLTYAGFEDIHGSKPQVGTSVLAVEAEENIEAPAIVTDLDEDRRLIYLAVAWHEFRSRPAGA